MSRTGDRSAAGGARGRPARDRTLRGRTTRGRTDRSRVAAAAPGSRGRLRWIAALVITLAWIGCGEKEGGSPPDASEGPSGSGSRPDAPAGRPSPASQARLFDPGPAEIGSPAPDFVLPDLDGTAHRLRDFLVAGDLVVLEWFDPDCPFVGKHHRWTRSMAQIYEEFRDARLTWLAIDSGTAGDRGRRIERDRRAAAEFGIAYPVLVDETGIVGRAYRVETTPQMFVIDPEGILVYAGAVDNNPHPGHLGEVNYVRRAIRATLAGRPVETPQTHPYGCRVP